MATLVPPKSAKRARLQRDADEGRASKLAEMGKIGPSTSKLVVQFRNGNDGSALGPLITLPAGTGAQEMNMIVNQLRRQQRDEIRANRTRKEKEEADSDDEEDDEDLPFAFHVALEGDRLDGKANLQTRLTVRTNLREDVLMTKEATSMGLSEEDTISVTFEPQAVFRVRPVRRCTSTLSGHASPILCSTFSPSASLLVTGSGDKSARIWDLTSESPLHTLSGHAGWVLCAEWEGRERRLATGDMSGQIRLWDAIDATNGKTGRLAWGAKTGEQVRLEQGEADKKLSSAEMRSLRHAAPKSHILKGHIKWITSLAWEPIHLNAVSPRLASSSKDGTVRVWNTSTRLCQYSLGGHTASVNVVRWSGRGLLYTASSDRTVKVWDAKDGKLVRTLNEHAHWVNTLSLSTDWVLRTGPFDHLGKLEDESTSKEFHSEEEHDVRAQRSAEARFQTSIQSGRRPEQLISGSDDHTLYLWPPQSHLDEMPATENGVAGSAKKPIARLTGHQKLVNHVIFSPDGRWIASASFDNSVKLWEARTGKFVATLRGHVASVYRIAWSADSRMLISASKDSTLKLWDLRTFKIRQDLPGHSDEVYCVDFAGDKVASGGRDKVLKIWRN
jgi:ribosome assembly protein 4